MTRSSPQDARATGSPWRATVLTLYPEMFPGPLGCAVAGRALESGVWTLETVDIRDFARDKHRTVDDHPFGGGPGMVMRPDVVARAVDSARERNGDVPVFCLSPRGVLLDQTRVQAFARGAGVMLLCGHFEGVDERLLERRGIEELSVGDYVLSGGEVAAMALIDACVRLLPGVLGAPESLAEESFEQGLLEYPQYTRPRVFEGKSVPEILLSGDHERIRRWRREQAEKITRERRADLWTRRTGTCGARMTGAKP